ncbi:hypothetical protein GPECTOR_34g700 [Gonium pectorale]|uniref:GYF domain-containing protein n=1 Tax=Gonium pectorale TaxID=33097 RepID=A0A150GCG2_GONPE|nr:hypothetical protein GPECTOR_34g700 [Gonium pectorale]|eukprot:KXZ47541.1 hypothetical protein GPECTOR_34g700 [Gonium pectorale]
MGSLKAGDRSGALHGPFQQAALRAWRNFLPMDLLVWYVELQPEEQQQQVSERRQGEEQREATDQQRGLSRKRPHEEEFTTEANNGEASGMGASAAGAQTENGSAAGLSGQGGVDECPEDRSEEAGAGKEGGSEDAPPSPKRPRCGHSSIPDAAADTVPEADAATAEAPAATRSPSASRAPTCAYAADTTTDGGVGDREVREPSPGPSTVEEAIACGLPGIELAELLGDGHLLADWRQRFPGSRPAGTAPPAPVHDHWLRAAAASLAAAHAAQTHAAQYGSYGQPGAYGYGYGHSYGGGIPRYGGDGGEAAVRPPRSKEESMLEYAEAVLAGLPPDDEAVVLARQAAAAGKSLTEVVNFSWGTAPATTTATATVAAPLPGAYGNGDGYDERITRPNEHGVPTEYLRDPRSGRLTAVDKDGQPVGGAKALYGEFGNWMDPEQIEDYLSKAMRWRKEQLPRLWTKKKLKEYREAKAKKAIQAMLQ